MIELRTPAEIDAMRPAGRFVAETLATLRDEAKVGTNLLAIDRRKLVNRQYLRYLAARLQLPKDVCRSLEQKFFASVD